MQPCAHTIVVLGYPAGTHVLNGSLVTSGASEDTTCTNVLKTKCDGVIIAFQGVSACNGVRTKV